MLARDAWIAASDFHSLSDREVLERVLQGIRMSARSETPLVLLDLDHTLYQVSPRTCAILHSAVRELGGKLGPAVTDLLKKLTVSRMGFSLRDTFRMNGLSPDEPAIAETLALLRSYWWDRFFTNEFLGFDQPYPGAPAFARAAHQGGAHLIYLTARERGGMERGTRQNLGRDGFPAPGDRATLLMKEDGRVTDWDHKVAAATEASRLGAVIASFENEPRNVADLQKLLPAASHVFVNTLCSELPAPPCRGLYRINSFAAIG